MTCASLQAIRVHTLLIQTTHTNGDFRLTAARDGPDALERLWLNWQVGGCRCQCMGRWLDGVGLAGLATARWPFLWPFL